VGKSEKANKKADCWGKFHEIPRRGATKRMVTAQKKALADGNFAPESKKKTKRRRDDRDGVSLRRKAIRRKGNYARGCKWGKRPKVLERKGRGDDAYPGNEKAAKV